MIDSVGNKQINDRKKGRKTQTRFYVQHTSRIEYIRADKRDYQCPFYH